MASIRVGAASWTDKTLIACKRFYPSDCLRAEARLRYYASLPPGRSGLELLRSALGAERQLVGRTHKAWLDEKRVASTLAFEREHRVVHVVADAPAGVANRTQTVWSATNPELAVVRLHGRNAETRNAIGAASAAARFNYDYSDDELSELAGPIRELAAQVADMHVVFNNCYEDYASKNARSLMRMIGE